MLDPAILHAPRLRVEFQQIQHIAEHGRDKPEFYNIVDHEPALVRDWLPALAQMLGSKPLIQVPVWLARRAFGRD